MIGCNPNSVRLEEGEELHDLQIHNLFLLQRKNGYMFTSDSVLLANFVKLKKNDSAIELCSGSGVVSVLVAAKNEYKQITSLELQESLFELGKKNFKINNIQNATAHLGRVQNADKMFGAESFDVAFCNPPFFEPKLLTAENKERAVARKEIELSLSELVFSVSKILKFGGSWFLVYQSKRLSEVFEELEKHNLEPKEIQFVQPKKNKESNIFLLRATKGGKKGLKVLPTLVMYDDDGEESQELKEIYQRKKKS